ncbi:hypothetical protein MJH12_08540 [bacterium]|nr:hypothetical protein [bacterium]
MELEELIEEFSQSRYNDLSIEKGDQSIYLRRGATKVVQTSVVEDTSSSSETSGTSKDETQGDFLKSDRVGTFSSTVKVGDQIKVGDKIGLITAINVPHDLLADKSGLVKALLLESGAGVAYGMDLIELEVNDV